MFSTQQALLAQQQLQAQAMLGALAIQQLGALNGTQTFGLFEPVGFQTLGFRGRDFFDRCDPFRRRINQLERELRQCNQELFRSRQDAAQCRRQLSDCRERLFRCERDRFPRRDFGR